MFRGISAVGSAQHWQCWGQGFESPMLHQKEKQITHRWSASLFGRLGNENPSKEYRPSPTRRERSAREIFFLNSPSVRREFGVRIPYAPPKTKKIAIGGLFCC